MTSHATRQDDWQPIETAPKDGTKILVNCVGVVTQAKWVEDDLDGYQGWLAWWASQGLAYIGANHIRGLPEPRKPAT